MTDFSKHEIRYTTLHDAPYLKQWLCFSEEREDHRTQGVVADSDSPFAQGPPSMLHWFPMSDEKELEDAVQCWIGFSRWSCSLTATLNDVPCGIGTLFLMPYIKVAHHALIKVIVDPHYQRQGIGTSLLKNLKHLAKNYFRLDLIHTEVYEGNPFIHLLQKGGFEECARQERYVKEGDRYLARLIFQFDLRSGI